MTEREARARAAWRSAVIAVVLNLVGMPMEMAIVRTVPEVSASPAIASMAVSAVLLAILLARRRRPPVALGEVAFFVNLAVNLAALWWIGRSYAGSGRLWMPFQEYKLGMVTVAMIAPQPWAGGVGVAAYAIASFLQRASFDPTTRDHLVMTEPWATIAFGVFSVIVLVYRVRQQRIEHAFAVTRARIEVTERYARVMIAVRDLANTPIQIIALAAEAARRREPGVGHLMDRVDRSLARLRELDRRLRGYEHLVEWRARDESIDAESTVTGAARIPEAS
jgi:hypothetical protein